LKKVFSILFISILLFNWAGYRFVVYFMEEKVNTELESALDNNEYNEAQLLSIKIPITYLPYYNNSASFERINGHVEIEGTEYKYVKRRIFNDSLELLCIPNHAVMNLKKVNNEFFQFENDLQCSGQDKNSFPRRSLTKSFSIDYCTINSFSLLTNAWFSVLSLPFRYTPPIVSRQQLIADEPPEII
jgi:hypothetical protein